ncbi:protein Tob2-like [Brienomyrus brachyistius]|uniref:protein Tob2-like n=1 Tax=Brienomyrus brachyistius TaxID=42636 RepID=UPI0020B3D28C|nr:protein Tob2-like [Brienomyrus brachyistius]XP_048871832.1 protein Tob2-like [Brienomyrus brachyistius]XP_048871833.1 protein Tob2-like [Brienomyrus brachyistius]
MHLEVKIASNFVVSYLYDKLPRRRADMFGEELERLLMARFEGHWYPETPLRGCAFRCLHLGIARDTVVELAARRSGLDMSEVRANVPPELSVWIDPYEVSYQIGESGEVQVLYLKDPSVQVCDIGNVEEECVFGDCNDKMQLEDKQLGFNPKAQIFIPVVDKVSPIGVQSLPSSPTHSSSHHNFFGYFGSCPAANRSINSSNSSTPSPPNPRLNYDQSQPQLPVASDSRPTPHPVTFTTASFAATKFGSTKMKCAGSGSGISPQPAMCSRSPVTVPHAGLIKHRSFSLHSFGSPTSNQMSPNTKDLIYPVSPVGCSFDSDVPPLPVHTTLPHPNPLNVHPTFGLFSSSQPGHSVGVVSGRGGISYLEKPTFMDGISGYNLQYTNHSSQPIVLAS